MKQKIFITTGLVILLLIFLLAALSGCRSVKEAEALTVVSGDTSTVKNETDGRIIKSDSVSFNSESSSQKKESNAVSEGDVRVTFSDTNHTDKPVTIKQNGDGSITVDPGGRQLKSITTRQRNQEQVKDISGTTTKNAVRESNTDSNFHAQYDSSGGNHFKENKVSTVEKKAPIPWYVWLLIAIPIAYGTYKLFTLIKSKWPMTK